MCKLTSFHNNSGIQDFSRYDAMVNSEEALIIQPDLIFYSILRDNLSSYIHSGKVFEF